jgi:hypothetical protein
MVIATLLEKNEMKHKSDKMLHKGNITVKSNGMANGLNFLLNIILCALCRGAKRKDDCFTL